AAAARHRHDLLHRRAPGRRPTARRRFDPGCISDDVGEGGRRTEHPPLVQAARRRGERAGARRPRRYRRGVRTPFLSLAPGPHPRRALWLTRIRSPRQAWPQALPFWDDLDLEHLRPELAGDEQSILGRVVGDAVEHAAALFDYALLG